MSAMNPNETAARRPIICLATIDWRFLFQRHQHLMSRLAKIGHMVYFVNATQISGTLPEHINPRLWVYGDFSKVPGQAKETAVYFVYHPAYFSRIAPDEQKFIVYDCVDDFPEFETHEQLALDRSDLMLCSSRSLYDKYRGRHPQLMLLPNGVEADHFRKKGKLPPQIAEIRASGRPIIGFAGALYKGWVDIDLLYYLAETHPYWHIVIIGESYAEDFTNAPPNLSYLGVKSYNNLPHYLAGFDVAIIPFLDNQISQGTDPIKLYEYTAAGLPVVSRNLPFAKKLEPPLLYSYNTWEECVSAIDRALSEAGTRGTEGLALRREFTARNGWDIRIDDLYKKLNELTWLENTRSKSLIREKSLSYITRNGIRHPMKVNHISQPAGNTSSRRGK